MNEVEKISKEIDKAIDGYAKTLNEFERAVFDAVFENLHNLKVKNGRIVTSVGNLKKINAIKQTLRSLVDGKDYLKGLEVFLQYFDKVSIAQDAYLTHAFADKFRDSTTDQAKRAEFKRIAVDNTIQRLSGAGLYAELSSKLGDILLRAVTTGAKISDLTRELDVFLIGEDKVKEGYVSRYAKTYATTALTQFTGNNNKLITDQVETDWFMYVGSNIDTTRPICLLLTEKRYIHKSEIPDILKGKVDGVKCLCSPTTGLPQGMIEGTTPENFQVNVGGWNCRHQLVPVSPLVVPKRIRARFESRE